jgi:hypothetical protein
MSALCFMFTFGSNPWATLTGSSASAHTNLSPTAELDPLLTHLTSTLGFLSRALAPAPLRRIARAVLATISNVFWDNVLSRHRFSTAGAAQLSADLEAICRVINKAIGSGVAEVGLRRCLEGAQLVGLPVKGGKSQVKSSDVDDESADDWNAWGGDEEVAPQKEKGGDTTSGSAELGLWEVEKRLFADNQSAREVLDELGFDMLSETEARAVLGRRVELAG